jgi:hypothetical protein
MDRPTDISQEEAGQMIANLVYRNEYPPPDRLQLLLVQYRDFKRRWDMFAWCFPWLERFMIWLSRKRARP